MPVYDDVNQTITFSPEELNNYVWRNLRNAISKSQFAWDNDFNLKYNSVAYSTQWVAGKVNPHWKKDSNDIYFIISVDEFNQATGLSAKESGKFALLINNGIPALFQYNVVLDNFITESAYLKVKEFIQLDVETQVLPGELKNEGVSETPATLVGINLALNTKQEPDGYKGDSVFEDEFQRIEYLIGVSDWWNGEMLDIRKFGETYGKLAPNPAGFGFFKQEFYDALPLAEGFPNTLYLIRVKNGDVVIGYKPYRWIPGVGYERIYNSNIPNLRAENKGQETPVKVANPPKEVDPLYNKVNLGIKTGEIKLPNDDVGTKLYKHKFSFDYNGGPDDIKPQLWSGQTVSDGTGYIISASSTPIANLLTLIAKCYDEKTLKVEFRMTLSTDGIVMVIGGTNVENASSFFYIKEDANQWYFSPGSIDEIYHDGLDVDGQGSFTDTVTEL